MKDDIGLSLGRLRNIKAEELELMLEWRNTPAVRENMYTHHVISLSDHLSWWLHVQDRTDQKYFMYEFYGKPFGIVAFNNVNTTNRNASWAFYASPGALQGTGGRMEFLALDYAFDVMKMHKLCCEVLSFNRSVIRLHEKFGFKVEGILRDQYLRNTQYFDIYRLGILVTEWEEIREAMLGKLIRLLDRDKQ